MFAWANPTRMLIKNNKNKEKIYVRIYQYKWALSSKIR
jgi:hypothetical protein